jgi:hypothetical protein
MLKLIFNRKSGIMIKFDDYYKMIALNLMILINLVQCFEDFIKSLIWDNDFIITLIIILYIIYRIMFCVLRLL